MSNKPHPLPVSELGSLASEEAQRKADKLAAEVERLSDVVADQLRRGYTTVFDPQDLVSEDGINRVQQLYRSQGWKVTYFYARYGRTPGLLSFKPPRATGQTHHAWWRLWRQ